MPDAYGIVGALGGLAGIATAIISAFRYLRSRLKIHTRMLKIEKLLLTKSQPNDNSIRVSQLASELGLTELQVIEAAARSEKIESWSGQLGNEYRLRIKQHFRIA
jgi:hypothetical protein